MNLHPPAFIRQLGLLCILAAWNLAAGIPASGRMVFRSLGPTEGLEHTSLTTLAQDAEGFLWVGTEGGAYRYDGTGFKLWSLREGLPSAWVRAFASMPDGRLWIGTRAGLCVLKDGKVSLLDPREPLASARIHQIVADAKGRVWVASDAGLFWSVEQGHRFTAAPGWPAEPAFSLALGKQGVWVGGSSALRQWQKDGTWRSWTPAQGVPKEPVTALLETAQGRLWLRTPKALRSLDPGNSLLKPLAANLPPLQVSIYEESLQPDGEGGVLVPTAKGLLHFPSGGAWELLDESRGIPSGWVNQALVDASGTLWMAGLGLYRLQGTGEWENFTRRDGLPGDCAWGMLRDRRGILWISTSGGLARMSEGKPEAFSPGAGMILYSMVEAPDGSIWGGGEHPFLVKISADRSRVSRIPLPPSPGLAVPVALAFDGTGSLWMATANNGLWRISDPDSHPTFHRAVIPGTGKLGQVAALTKDPRDRLWATTGQGLACFDHGQWRIWGTGIGLRQASLWAMAPMRDGTAWIAYAEPLGLTRIDLSGDVPKVVEHRSRKEGLASDSVYSLAADPADRLWVGGPRGVQRWDGERHWLFRREDGLAGTDCNPFATWVDANGDVWFGSTAGLMRHRASIASVSLRLPETRITAFRLGAHEWDPLPSGLQDLGTVSWADRNATASFTSLAYEHEGRLHFQGRLLGLEEEWVDLRSGTLRYPALFWGTYVLELRALVEDGSAGPVASIRFHILPPWWIRWWAWLLWLPMAGFFAFLGDRWRVRRLQRRNDELGILVAQRTEALELSNLALATISTTDPLTGLRNRRYLDEQLPSVLARLLRVHREQGEPASAHDSRLVFALLDIDHFKRVNDTLSHAAGDMALIQVAEVLRREARESDFLIRWGGEEILFIGHTTDLEGAASAVDRLHQAIRNHPFDLGQPEPVHLTCSIGFALFPFQTDLPESNGWEDLVRTADRCLYAAKRTGRDSWVGVTARPGQESRLSHHFDQRPGDCVEAGMVDLRTSLAGRRLNWE